uniref:Sodium/calcium exchanger membrane region domain-containing protein n=1 Tax=Ditylenchus dipsaci TaxID=166011 RepID=A0A915CV85_9BILA
MVVAGIEAALLDYQANVLPLHYASTFWIKTKETQQISTYDEKCLFPAVCQYVQRNSDLCEGGGYILWSELKVCADSPFLELVVVILSLVFFIYLFVLLSTTADDFFCANIACIIDHHQISQNIAGITIMAFGNGSSDIFSSIASVISVKNPQAGLAIMLYDNEIHVWQPCMFLLLYIIYAFTVISGNLVRQRLRKNKRKSRLLTKAIFKVSGILPKKPKSGGAKVAPIASIAEFVVVDKNQLAVNGLQVTPASLDLGGKLAESTTAVPASNGTLVIPINEKDKQRQGEDDEYTSANDYLEAGKFFVKEELDNEDEEQDSVTTSSSLIVLGENKEKLHLVALLHPNVMVNTPKRGY